MQLIDKNYINKKIAKRKGKCLKCGKCCEGCKFLDKKTRLCRTYDNRPWNCYKEFPLDELDLKIWEIDECGYNFTK